MTEKDGKKIEALIHDEATRKNIPTAEYQPVLPDEDRQPKEVRYARGAGGLEDEKAARDPDLDPQLIWRGKDQQDWSDLVVQAPPLFIQEKIHPKVLIDDLRRQSGQSAAVQAGADPEQEQLDLFGDFNGIAEDADKTEFYRHDANWTNRMILGDSLQVMASLAEREGLRGKVQCIYIDPPYGIKFNSNFQWSTTSRDVKDGNRDHITREPEQVKAFRDTWRDGIHSYLTYLRDRLTVARDLLTDSGSVFVQIGDENVHRVRALLDDVFGNRNFVAQITVQKTGAQPSDLLPGVSDYILWFARDLTQVKSRRALRPKEQGIGHGSGGRYTSQDEWGNWYRQTILTSSKPPGSFPVDFCGKTYVPKGRYWTTGAEGVEKLVRAGRVESSGKMVNYKRFLQDFPAYPITSIWTEVAGSPNKTFVVQTSPPVVQRCVLMSTDPGDLVLDPTCGSGTTATVAEQWGRRWITIDTSRVALALARARIMGARYPYYLLADSKAGQIKEAEVTRTAPSTQPTRGDIRQGFVYQRVPHVTLKSIANNAEIDVIWEQWQPQVQEALDRLNAALRGHATPFKVSAGGRLGKLVHFDAVDCETFTMPSGEVVPAYALVDWEVPREAPLDWLNESDVAEEDSPRRHEEHGGKERKNEQTPCPPCLRGATISSALKDFWEARIARQREIDASIAAKADFEYLYDKPYEDRRTVRVAGPFTVESLSPHRVLGVDEDDELIGVDDGKEHYEGGNDERDFVGMILESLRAAGVQQAHKEGRIGFTSLNPWPGELVCAEGRFSDAIEEDSPASHGEHAEDNGKAPRSPNPCGEQRAAIFIGPEFGTVSRPDLVQAAREAADAGFDLLIACAFSYDAHSADLTKLGRVPILKARMNADLHMATELADTGKGNLFVIFGEPDIDILPVGEGAEGS